MGVTLFSLKPYVILLYGTFGLTCLHAAGTSGGRIILSTASGELQRRWTGSFLVVLAAAALLVVYIKAQSFLLIDGAVIAAIIFLLRPASWESSGSLFGGVSTAVLVLSLAWWRIEPSSATMLPLAFFAVVLSCLGFGLSDPGPRRAHPALVPAGLFAIGGFALLADLGAFRVGQSTIVALVHHWGAFTGPALHIRAGLVPLFDVPLQYGLGPTLAIAASCEGSDCWTGSHIIFAGAHLAVALLVLSMALTTQTRRGILWVCAVTIIVFVAAFLWIGFAAEGGSAIAYPSSGGMRFLPVTFVAWLWFRGSARAAAVAMVPALLWSPESAGMSLAVFALCGTANYGFRKAAFISAALLIGTYVALFLVHRSIFGTWIDPLALIEYVLHVPGPRPINLWSDILLLMATLGLGGWLVFSAPDGSQEKRRDLAVTALLFAAASCTLGRSHPNNVCNLAPFLVLVGLRALDRPANESSSIGKSVALGLSVSAAALAFSPWTILPFDPNVIVDAHKVVAGFPEQEPEVMRIRSQIPQTPELGIADFGPHFSRHPTESIVWTPMDPSSLWRFVPSDRRRVYIERSARRLRRSGWAIFAPEAIFLLDDLKTAYDVTNMRSVDGAPDQPNGPPKRYTVVCMDPKPQVAAIRTGPSCPTEGEGSLKSALAR